MQISTQNVQLKMLHVCVNLNIKVVKLKCKEVKLKCKDVKLKCKDVKLKCKDAKLKCKDVKLKCKDVKLRFKPCIIIFIIFIVFRVLVINDFWIREDIFKVIPEIYNQLYNIHVQYDSGIAYHRIRISLIQKEGKKYVKMLLEEMLIDFKKAIRVVFVNIETVSCFFVYHNQLQRKYINSG